MKLITWNIQWCRGCDGRAIGAHARALADFDVPAGVAANCSLDGSRGENQFSGSRGCCPGYTPVPPHGSRHRRRAARARAFSNMI